MVWWGRGRCDLVWAGARRDEWFGLERGLTLMVCLGSCARFDTYARMNGLGSGVGLGCWFSAARCGRCDLVWAGGWCGEEWFGGCGSFCFWRVGILKGAVALTENNR